MIQFDSYFSNGLKPPTRMARPHFFLVYFDPTSYYMVRLNRPVRRSTSRWAIEQILGSLRYVGAFRIIPMFYRDYNKELYIRISIKQLKWPFDHPNGGQKTTSGSRIKTPNKGSGKEPGDWPQSGQWPKKWWKSYQQMVKILPTNGENPTKKWVQILSVDSRYWFRELGAICSLNCWTWTFCKSTGHRVLFPEPNTNMAATPPKKKPRFWTCQRKSRPLKHLAIRRGPPQKTHPSTECRLKSPFHWVVSSPKNVEKSSSWWWLDGIPQEKASHLQVFPWFFSSSSWSVESVSPGVSPVGSTWRFIPLSKGWSDHPRFL